MSKEKDQRSMTKQRSLLPLLQSKIVVKVLAKGHRHRQELPFDPAILLLGINSKEFIFYILDTC